MSVKIKQQQQHLKKLFSIFDKNGDGFISQDELKVVVKSVGLLPSESEIKAIFDRADENHNGELDFEEFCKFVTNALLVRLDDEKEIVRAFNAFDKDGNGLIDASELQAVMSQAGTDMNEQQIAQLISELDVDGDGNLNYMEFRMMMMK